MNQTKGINFKSLAIVMFSTLLFSFLWVSITYTFLYSNLSLGEKMYAFAVLGYFEVAIGYIVLLLLLYGIINYFVKRNFRLSIVNVVIIFIVWSSVFSCMENWIPILFSDGKYFVELYIPPFFLKILFFIYYIYKWKLDNKKNK